MRCRAPARAGERLRARAHRLPGVLLLEHGAAARERLRAKRAGSRVPSPGGPLHAAAHEPAALLDAAGTARATGGVATGGGHTGASTAGSEGAPRASAASAAQPARRSRRDAARQQRSTIMAMHAIIGEYRGLGVPRDCRGAGDRRRDRVVDVSEEAEGRRRRALSVRSVQDARDAQREFRDRRLEARAVLGDASGSCRASCRPAWRIDEPLEYSNVSPGLSTRLLAHHAQAAHFLHLVVRVGDDPVAAHELRGDVAVVA